MTWFWMTESRGGVGVMDVEAMRPAVVVVVVKFGGEKLSGWTC